MGVFTSLFTAIVVCGILRAVVSIIMPDGSMKSIVDVGTNAVIFASLAGSVIDLIKQFL